MEKAKLRIVTDTPPPRIVAQTTLEAFLARPINKVVAGAIPRRSGGLLKVDDVLARSLPKVVSEKLRGSSKELEAA